MTLLVAPGLQLRKSLVKFTVAQVFDADIKVALNLQLLSEACKLRHNRQGLWPPCLAGLLSKSTGAHNLHKAIAEMLAHRSPPQTDPTVRGSWRPPWWARLPEGQTTA